MVEEDGRFRPSILPRVANRLIRRKGWELRKQDGVLADISDRNWKIIEAVRPFTMTSPERINALIDAVRYVQRFNITGDVVECGVWRGGSMMAVAHTLLEMSDTSRALHLFDTFSGMTSPTDVDVGWNDRSSAADFLRTSLGARESLVVGLDEVRSNMESTGYPANAISFVEGKVEDTIPGAAPESIAILRLDTDWYESTAHELQHLVSRISPNGVLIIDDYGFWAGARKAVDEFVASYDRPILLQRVDDSGRVAVLP